jgi:DNA-binding NtrC family response regulator
MQDEGVLQLRRCKLTVDDAAGTVTDYIFDTETVSVGSDEGNDLVIPDASVSRAHALVVRRGEEYLVRDLDSANGTFVGAIRVAEAWLRPGVPLRFGNVEVQFQPLRQRIEIVPSQRDRLGEIVGASLKMRELFAVMERIQDTDATVLIEGETGTGKEIVARTLHRLSPRKDGPFVVVDCGAIPENLLESELFGHERGSFTGAVAPRVGLMEQADGGTLFLDEIGELTRDLQPKLLRVLEQREVKRVGSNKPLKVDVRFVAATNRDLKLEVEEGRFRQDLFYRLNVVRLPLPPLRERPEDVPLLVRAFLKNLGGGRGDKRPRVEGITQEALSALMAYKWPGNVRELLNVVERAGFFAAGSFIDLADLPEPVVGPRKRTPRLKPEDETVRNTPLHADLKNYHEARDEYLSTFERDYLQQLLTKTGYNLTHAAREAGVDRKHLRFLLKKHGLDISSLKNQ